MVLTRGEVGGRKAKWVKGVKYMITEKTRLWVVTLGRVYRYRIYCTPKMYIMLSAHVPSINLISLKKKKWSWSAENHSPACVLSFAAADVSGCDVRGKGVMRAAGSDGNHTPI